MLLPLTMPKNALAFILLELFCALFFCVLCGWMLLHYRRWSIMPNSSSRPIIAVANSLLQQAGLNPNDNRLVDCGAGLGLSLKYWHDLGWTQAIGFEGSWLVWKIGRAFFYFWDQVIAWRSKAASKKQAHSLLHGEWQSSWSLNPREGDILFIYINRAAMEKLALMLRQENAPWRELNFWVLSHTFALNTQQSAFSKCLKGLYHTPVYLYRIRATAHANKREKLPECLPSLSAT